MRQADTLERTVMSEILEEVKRSRHCVSDEHLARIIGISPSTLSHYRSGTRWPSLQRVEEIAQLLGADPEAILAALRTERQSRRQMSDG